MLLRWTLFLILGISCNLLTGQEGKGSPFRARLIFGNGFMITHSPIMEYVSEQHFRKTEFSIEKRLIGNRAWERRHNYPFGGVSIAQYTFDKEEFFGHAYSLAPYYSFSLYRSDHWELLFRSSLGLGWIEKEFDLESNHKNVAIGSHVNIFVSLMSELQWKPVERWNLSLGINFSHFSNTGFKTPNLGINLPMAEIGITHQFGKSPELIKEKDDDRSSKDLTEFFQFRLGFGASGVYPVEGPTYLATAFSVEWEKELSLKSNFGGGLDLFYNPAQITNLKNDSIQISKWQNLQMGISAQYLIKFGVVSMGAKAGAYLKSENKELGSTYQEIYGHYRIYKNINYFMSMKTHLFTAEYFLFGFKYSLK